MARAMPAAGASGRTVSKPTSRRRGAVSSPDPSGVHRKDHVRRMGALELFDRLLGRYGRQDWWPAESDFEMMVGSILVQHTAWGNVSLSLDRLRAEDLLNPEAMAGVEPDRLQHLIRHSGFMKAKARALLGLSAWLVGRGTAGADVEASDDPGLRDQLISLPGIGPETADVIRLYAFDQKCFIWDTYARRLLGELGYDHLGDYEQARRHGEGFIDLDSFGLDDLCEFHGLIVAAGKEAGRQGGWDFLPHE